ncbi:LIP, partial [Symbiodinium necroappetens]
LQDFNQDMTCTPKCPAARRLAEEPDGLTSLEQCLERCPSVGFMAAMEFGDCRASCERKHPAAGKKVPASEPPLEGCKRTCRQHKGNFWHFLYSNCAKTCAAKTALTQVQYMQKYNVSFGKEGEEDLQAEVTALLRTRFKFKKRSSNHPFSFILETYQSKVAEAVAKVLEIPEKAPPPRVVIRQYRPGIHHVVPNVLIKDPGNDVEAVVDIKGMSISDVKKLGDNSTLEQIDKELKMSLVRDVTTVGLAEVSPTEALESTSSSIQGDFMSLGWHTVCRLNEADTTFDGQGKVRVVHGQSLRQCSINPISALGTENADGQRLCICIKMRRWTAALLLIWLCLAEEEQANCAEEVERKEESETESLRVQLLQQREFRLQRGPLTTAEVPAKQQFSLPVAKAFATVSQAAFCGADEELRNWTCKACHDVGFSLTLGTRRLVRQAELGEADSTFVFVSRAEWMPEKPEAEWLWPPARAKEPLKHGGQDCYTHCGQIGGFCAWCGVGNACCRKDEAGDPAECANATGFIGSEYHECVAVAEPVNRKPVLHGGEDCWLYCGKAGGFCDWCGAGNACCRSGYDKDPLECRGAAANSSHHVCTTPARNVPQPTTKREFGCILAIRGSKTFTNALHDAFFWSDELPVQECDGCQVFDGFWRVWSGVEAKLGRVLIDNGCIPGTEHGTILLTGHSLGAAVATIGMYMLQLRGYSVGLSYNFESPRVGNEAFHDAFDVMFGRKVDLWRITRSRDPVPHVPPLPIYHHVGSEAYFPKDTKEPVVCLESEDSKCADRYSLLETLIFGWDHCKSEIAAPGRGYGEGICQCAAE